MTPRSTRVGLWAPAIPPSTRGNAITVSRLVQGLGSFGVECRVALLDELVAAPGRCDFTAFDVLHFFHLLRSYDALATEGAWKPPPVPYVLTQTGTDLLDDGRSRPHFGDFLVGADHMVVGTEGARAQLLAQYPRLDAARVSLAWKGVSFSLPPSPLPEPLSSQLVGRTAVLLPAHVRPVKGIDLAIAAWPSVVRRVPAAFLILAGSTLDAEYAKSLSLDSVVAAWHGELPRVAMVDAYRRSTLVLSTSVAESLPNALLEALHLGRPVLAPDIAGTREIARLADPPLSATGTSEGPLFWFDRSRGPVALADRIVELLADPSRLERQGALAAAHFAGLAATQRESQQLAAVYREVAQRGRGP